MNIKIEDHEKQNTRVIIYPGTVLQFVKVHFIYMGLYQVEKIGTNAYTVYDKWDRKHVYTISKAKKGDITK